jgi:hypothetical protein
VNNDFEDQCKEIQNHLNRIKDDINEMNLETNARNEQIDTLLDEIRDLGELAGVDLKLPSKRATFRPNADLDELITALSVIPEDRRLELSRQFLHSVPAFPPFDKFDIFLLAVLGGLAALAEFLLVGLPPKTHWTPKSEGGIVPTGWLSEQLKSWQVSDNNRLAQICKVPFDKPYLPGTDAGLTPFNHRLLTFGHDPSPLGMVYGLMDIVSGGMSGITRDGQIFHIPGVPPTVEKILMAPLLWIGHLASDVATPMGLPPPGWALTQLLRIPSPGAPGEATIADVARMMYEQGYDFRHYLAGGIVPAIIEIVVRTYHFVRYSYPAACKKTISANLAETCIANSQLEGHRTAMLFWAHATAAAVNAGKIVIQGAYGDYFSAARAINVAQWQMFAVRAAQYLAFRLRDKKVEQIVLNRKAINERWDQLSAKPAVYGYFASSEAPSLTVLEGGKP